MEVDDAPSLELRDLDEGDSGTASQLAGADPELAPERAAQSDGETAPQRSGAYQLKATCLA